MHSAPLLLHASYPAEILVFATIPHNSSKPYHSALVEHVEECVLLQGHAREGGGGGLHLGAAAWHVSVG